MMSRGLNLRDMNTEKAGCNEERSNLCEWCGEWRQRQRQMPFMQTLLLRVPQSFVLTETLKPKKQTKYYCFPKTFLI